MSRDGLQGTPRDVPQSLLLAFLDRMAVGEAEKAALVEAASPARAFTRDAAILRQGDRPQGLSVLGRGIARAVHCLPKGRQQMVALFVPGDALGYTPLSGPSRISISALTPCAVIQIPDEKLKPLMARFPDIAKCLWIETARQALIQLEWMVSLGRLSAYARLAHFICELDWRFRASGLATDGAYIFPLTQGELADALGLSAVHVNRIVQRLRQDGLLTLDKGRLTIADLSRLYDIAEFDPEYLRSGAAYN